MPHDVFFCHAHQDSAAADALCAAFEAAGLRCWIAPRDITAGMKWAGACTEGINGSHIVLVLLSADSNISEQVQHEVHLADSKGRHLLPVRIQDIAPCSALEYYLGNQHWFDAFPPPAEQYAPRLIDHVRKLLAEPLRKKSAADAPKPSDKQPAAAAPKKHTVLVVDDDEEIRLQVRTELAKDGCLVVQAEDGGKALAKLQEMPKPPDLIILDMMMPVLDGVEFLHRFRADARNARIPVVVLTSQSGQGWKAATSGLGADAFLSKPLLPKELRACVRGLLQPGSP